MRKTAAFGFVAGLFVFATLLFTGCDNFLKGEDVKNEIVQAIDYNNAPYYTIKIETVGDSGVVRTHFSGTAVQKVTDTFTVKFEPKDDYKFISWEAVVGDLKSGESASDYIVFESPQSLETKVTFKKASDKITIRPVCPKRLTYTFEQGTGEIFPRDTSLVLKFSEALSSECEPALENLTIQATDDDASPDTATYFATPKIYEDKIIFSSNTANGFISIPASGRRAITVKLAKEKVFYICNQYSTPVKVYLDSDIVQTCFIGPETSKKVNLKYSVRRQADETPLGTLKINGRELDTNDLDTEEFAYSVGTDLTIKYKLPENYTFKKWSFLGEDGNPVEADKLNIITTYEDNPAAFGYDAATNTAQVTLSIFNPMEQTVTVYPEILDPVKIVAVKVTDEEQRDENATMRANDVLLTQDSTDFALGIGKSITFKYKFSDTHKFYSWKVSRQFVQNGQTKTEEIALTKQAMAAVNLDYAFDDSADEKGLVAALYTTQITITVKDYIDGTIKVTPDVRPIPVVTIKLDGKHGNFTPAKDYYEVKEGSVNSISFEAAKDFGFVCWKVCNAETGKEIKNQNYITFADYKKENTTYTLVNAPEDGTNLAVMPYVLECPNILSRWPQYDAANGSRSDTTIEIVFDHDMDPDCILYTQDELEALPTGVTPLESSVHPGRFYGYETAAGDRVFKNIQLTEKQNNANVAKYYGEPVFEDPMTLFIPVVSYDKLTAGKIIIISLENDFHYKDKETNIPVYIGSSEKKWRYIVNGGRDNSAPTYDDTIEFSVTGTNIYTGSTVADFNNLNGCFISDGSSVTLTLNNVLVSDSESYPTTMFIMEFKKVYNDKFSALTAPEDYSRTIDYDYALGTSAKYGVLPASDPDTGSYKLTNLQDGVYSVRYKFKDRSGNTAYYPARTGTAENPIDNYFFFAVDTNSPELAGPISEVASAKTASSVTIAVPGLVWDSNDIKSKKLIYTPQGGNATEFAITSLGTNVELTGLAAGTQYSIKAKIEDYSGKTYESDAITVYTKPNAPTNLALNNSSLEQNSFTVNWTSTAGNYDNYTLYYKKATDTAYTTKTINKGTTTYSLSSLSPKTKYNCYLVSKKNNVESEPVLLNVVTKPAVPTLTKVESLYTNGNPGFNITWTKPASGTYDSIQLYISKSDTFPANGSTTYIKDLKDVSSGSFTVYNSASTVLENDTQYYAKIVTKATVDNTTLTSESTDKSCYSCLSPVSGVAYDHSYDPDGDDSDVFIDPDVSDDTRDYSKVHGNAPSLKLKWTNSNKAQDSGIQVMENDSTVLQTFEGSDLEECIVTEVIGNTFYKLGVRRYKVVNGTTLYSPITYCAAAKLTKPAPVAFTVTEIENDAEGGLFNQIEFSWVNPNPNLPGVGGYHTEKLYCFSFDGNRNWKKCFEVDFNEEENIKKYSQGSYSVDKAIGITTENRFYLSFVANQAATDRWSDTLYKPSIKVRNLTVTKTSNGTTTIKWLNPSDISNYTIQCWKKVGNGDYELYKSFTSAQTTDSDSISDQIETYYYQFKILDRFGNPFSNGETVTAKLPVMRPVIIDSALKGNTTVSVTWSLPNRGVGEHTGFRVEVKFKNNSKKYIVDVDEDATQAAVPIDHSNIGSTLESVYVYTVYDNGEALSMVQSEKY